MSTIKLILICFLCWLLGLLSRLEIEYIWEHSEAIPGCTSVLIAVLLLTTVMFVTILEDIL